MTQLKSGQTPAGWKQRQVSPGCDFGVKSYLHQFYEGPESVDLDIYEDEDCERDAVSCRRLHGCSCPCAGWLRPLLLLSLLLLASAAGLLLMLALLPPRLAIVSRRSDVSAAQLAALAAACMGATGTLVAVCFMLEVKSGKTGRRRRFDQPTMRTWDPIYTPAAPASPIEKQVPATEKLISIQPDAPPRYDITQ